MSRVSAVPEYNINCMPGWSIPWNSPCTSSRILWRAFIVSCTKAGRPIKWGGKWDICFPDGRTLATGQYCLNNMTYKEWVDLAKKHEKPKPGYEYQKAEITFNGYYDT